MRNDISRIKKILSKNLKHYRAKGGFTQETASEIAGITVKYWQRLEMTSQTDLPSLETLFKIAKALRTKPSELLNSK